VFCAEASQDQPTLTEKNAQSKKIETAFNINIVCSMDKKSQECFSYRESLYKKLGCQLRKDTCEQMVDGINSMAICVKADAATKKGRKDAIK